MHPAQHPTLLHGTPPLRLQAGNDFLPNIPSLEIYDRPSGLDTLLKVGLLLVAGLLVQLRFRRRQVPSDLDRLPRWGPLKS